MNYKREYTNNPGVKNTAGAGFLPFSIPPAEAVFLIPLFFIRGGGYGKSNQG